MSTIDLINEIDQALIERAKNNLERLESLREHYLEFIERINKELKDKYSIWDQIYLHIRDSLPTFEKDLLDLENIKINSERHLKEIEELLRENSQDLASTSSTSFLNIPD